MPDKLVLQEPPSVEAGGSGKTFLHLRWTSGIAALLIAAASFILMVYLIHAPGLLKGAAILTGVASLAVAIAYAIRKFVRRRVKSDSWEDNEGI